MKTCELQSFAALENRYYFSAEVVAQTGLRVGAGKRSDMAATDQPVIRDAAGRPFIPGSSLKGAMRSWLEKVLRGLHQTELWSCNLFVKGEVCIEEPTSKGKPARGKLTDEQIRRRLCTACSLFGSAAYAGRLYFQDLPILTDFRLVELRDGVGIDRILGTAAQGIKYDTEVVAPGSRFSLKVVAENLDPLRLALVVIAFEQLAQGEIPIGGMTTRGLGQIKLENLELKQTSAADLLSGKEPTRCSWMAEKQKAVLVLEQRIGNQGGDAHAPS